MVGHFVSVQSQDLHPGVGQRSHLSAEAGHVELCDEWMGNRLCKNIYRPHFISRDPLFNQIRAICLSLSCQIIVDTNPVLRALIPHHITCAQHVYMLKVNHFTSLYFSFTCSLWVSPFFSETLHLPLDLLQVLWWKQRQMKTTFPPLLSHLVSVVERLSAQTRGFGTETGLWLWDR